MDTYPIIVRGTSGVIASTLTWDAHSGRTNIPCVSIADKFYCGIDEIKHKYEV